MNTNTHLTSFGVGPSKLHPSYSSICNILMMNHSLELSHRDKRYSLAGASAAQRILDFSEVPAGYQVFYFSSGTECMHWSLQNVVYEKLVVHVVNGAFGKRWYENSRATGKHTFLHEVPDNTVADLSTLWFKDVPPEEVDAICITQNETSTGGMTSLEKLSILRGKYPNALIMVDMVSSYPIVKADFSKIDIAFASVHKAIGLPAGLAIMIVSPEAIKRAKSNAPLTRVPAYRSFAEMEKLAKKGQTPETANMALVYALDKVFEKYQEIGRNDLYSHVSNNALELYEYVFKSTKHLHPFVQGSGALSITTPVFELTDASAKELTQALLEKGLYVPPGYGEYSDRHIRIGNFPAHTEEEVKMLLVALKELSAVHV